jgi:dihydrofolate reductase
MRKLVYATSLSLDGYIDAEAGDPSWVVPDEELHRHFNDIEREIDTLLYGDAVTEVARLKAQPGRAMGVGGLILASSLASAGLIDEYRLYYVPIVLGSGKAAFSRIQNRVRLKPVETRTFSSGTVLLRCVPVST